MPGEPATESRTVSATYEFRVTGTVGPVVRSALDGLSASEVPRCTVLYCHFDHPDDLERLLDALHAHGSVLVGLRVRPGVRSTRRD